MPRFTMPRDIYFGRGSIGMLARIRGKRVMLVTAGEEMGRHGFLQRAESELRRTGMELRLLESSWPKLPERTVREGAAEMRAFEPDWIAALGSPAIDAAKLMWIFYEYPEAALDDLRAPYSVPGLRRKARFAAIPGFCGDAPETTAFAALAGSPEQSAWAAADYDIVPDVAFIDPDLSAHMPPEAVAEAGMGVLAHAVGACAARRGAAFTEPLAEKAAELVFHELIPARAGDGTALELLHYAQCLAGAAFSNGQAGLPYAFSRQLAGIFPECRARCGAVSGILLPHIIRFNAEDDGACARYARLAQRLGFRGRNGTQAALMLAEETESLRQALMLPDTLRGLGIGEAEFERQVHAAAARVAEDFCVKENLRAVSESAAVKILLAAYGP